MTHDASGSGQESADERRMRLYELITLIMRDQRTIEELRHDGSLEAGHEIERIWAQQDEEMATIINQMPAEDLAQFDLKFWAGWPPARLIAIMQAISPAKLSDLLDPERYPEGSQVWARLVLDHKSILRDREDAGDLSEIIARAHRLLES